LGCDSYVHNSVGPDVGKSAAIVALKCDKQTEAIADAAKKLAMHITAARPEFLDESRVPADVMEKERQIYREQAASSGKPANIVEKMTEGRMKKFLAENTLVGQPHMIEPNNPVVSQFLKQLGEKEGTNIEITDFVRYTVGEQQASN
jgi:elongation factor Ts